MATSYPLPTLAVTVSASGISAPSYADLLASLQASFRTIFGSDAYLGADSQDGQLLAVFAQAIHDCNMAAVSVYNSFSPTYAQGTGLSALVGINGIQRRVSTHSQVNLLVSGTVGATITSGKVRDASGTMWSLPPSVVIPPAGFVLVTATCDSTGAITAGAGTLTTIATPTLGWTSVTNPSAAVPGAPVETDAELRQRQARSVALPAKTVLSGLLGALQALPGVLQAAVYENPTGAPDGEGIPAHAISAVVEGGNADDIARTILLYKTPGAATYGTTTVNIHDDIGQAYAINYFAPSSVGVKVSISLHAFAGYSSATADSIKAAIAAYINALPFGQDVLLTRLYLPAMLNGAADSDKFQLVTLEQAKLADALAAADVVIAFNERAACSVANVTVTVV